MTQTVSGAQSEMMEERGVFWRLHENGLSVEFEFRCDQDGEVEISGFHKWDGCVNWNTNPDCMYHFCGADDAERLTAMFRTVAAIASREIGDYCGEWLEADGLAMEPT